MCEMILSAASAVKMLWVRKTGYWQAAFSGGSVHP